MASVPNPLFTVQQYLDMERAAEYRSEYLCGEIFAMSGGSVNHAVIAMALGIELGLQLRGQPCTVAGSDLRLYCESSQMLTYPDVVVFCGPRKFRDGKKDTLTDATVVAEVLSPSTASYDRSHKFHYYRGLPSLREYLLISQSEIRAELCVRQEDGSWLLRDFNGPECEIPLESIGCRVALGALYERVEFETA